MRPHKTQREARSVTPTVERAKQAVGDIFQDKITENGIEVVAERELGRALWGFKHKNYECEYCESHAMKWEYFEKHIISERHRLPNDRGLNPDPHVYHDRRQMLVDHEHYDHVMERVQLYRAAGMAAWTNLPPPERPQERSYRRASQRPTRRRSTTSQPPLQRHPWARQQTEQKRTKCDWATPRQGVPQQPHTAETH